MRSITHIFLFLSAPNLLSFSAHAYAQLSVMFSHYSPSLMAVKSPTRVSRSSPEADGWIVESVVKRLVLIIRVSVFLVPSSL